MDARDLPDLNHIRSKISILDVARELGIRTKARGATWTMAHCFRPDKHKAGDRTPSLCFQVKANRYTCQCCDGGHLHSNIDLVMAVEQCTLQQAGKWFDEHYPGIPRIKARKTGRNVFDFRAGVDEFQNPDDLVKAGLLPRLNESTLRVFYVLAAFRDSNNPDLSYETLKLRTGIRSNRTVCRAVRELEKLHVLKVERGWAKGKAGRAQNRYEFTLDDPELFNILAGRAEAEPNPTPKPAPQGEGSTYQGSTRLLASKHKPPILSAHPSALKPLIHPNRKELIQ